MKRMYLPLAGVIASALLLAGCGASSPSFNEPEIGLAAPQMDMSSGTVSGKNGFTEKYTEDTFNGIDDNADYIIRSASLSIQVENIEGKSETMREVIKKHEGEITHSGSRIRDRELSVGNGASIDYWAPITGDYAYMTVQIPVEKFDDFMEDARGVGKVITESSSSENVTSDVLSLESRIKSEKASLERLESLLDDANSVDEVLSVERAVQERKSNIASLEMQSSSLRNQAAKSTVVIQLVTDKANQLTPDEMNWFQKTWDRVSDSSSDAIALSIVVVMFLIPLAGFYFLISALIRRGRSRRLHKVMDQDLKENVSSFNESEIVDGDDTTEGK